MVEWMPKKENGSENISMTWHEMHIAARDNREILADNLPPTMDRVGLFTSPPPPSFILLHPSMANNIQWDTFFHLMPLPQVTWGTTRATRHHLDSICKWNPGHLSKALCITKLLQVCIYFTFIIRLWMPKKKISVLFLLFQKWFFSNWFLGCWFFFLIFFSVCRFLKLKAYK